MTESSRADRAKRAQSDSAFVRLFGERPWYAQAVKKVAKVDLALQKISGGRFGMLRIAGFPNLLLTTTGRKTGRSRAVCLMYVPYGTDYIVVGSNIGQPTHPAWSANLIANPSATVTTDGKAFSVLARLVTGRDRDAVWGHVVNSWPDFATYAERAGSRELRVFVLSKEKAWPSSAATEVSSSLRHSPGASGRPRR